MADNVQTDRVEKHTVTSPRTVLSDETLSVDSVTQPHRDGDVTSDQSDLNSADCNGQIPEQANGSVENSAESGNEKLELATQNNLSAQDGSDSNEEFGKSLQQNVSDEGSDRLNHGCNIEEDGMETNGGNIEEDAMETKAPTCDKEVIKELAEDQDLANNSISGCINDASLQQNTSDESSDRMNPGGSIEDATMSQTGDHESETIKGDKDFAEDNVNDSITGRMGEVDLVEKAVVADNDSAKSTLTVSDVNDSGLPVTGCEVTVFENGNSLSAGTLKSATTTVQIDSSFLPTDDVLSAENHLPLPRELDEFCQDPVQPEVSADTDLHQEKQLESSTMTAQTDRFLPPTVDVSSIKNNLPLSRELDELCQDLVQSELFADTDLHQEKQLESSTTTAQTDSSLPPTDDLSSAENHLPLPEELDELRQDFVQSELSEDLDLHQENSLSLDMSIDTSNNDKTHSTCHAHESHSSEHDKSVHEICANIKEPEELEHQSKCQLLHEHTASCDQESVRMSTAKSDNWLYVLGHDKLKKKILKHGQENVRPDYRQRATIRCVGKLENGTEIDRFDELKLVVGDAEFIQAFDLCLPLMDKGEVAEIVTESCYAYGTLGRDPDVPPNAKITYEVELISFENVAPFSSLPVSERLRLSNEKKERGNQLYARNDCKRAIDTYLKAIEIAGDDKLVQNESPADLQQLLDTRVTCYNNLAAAQLKIDAWDAAISSCDHVLRVQPNNVKALFRKGKCLANKGDYDAAIAVLRRAVKLEPDTKIIQQELARLEKRNKAQTRSQKEMYKKMLGTTRPVCDKKKVEESSKSWMWYTVAAASVVVASVSFAAYRRFSHF